METNNETIVVTSESAYNIDDLAKDYKYALVHLAWCICGGKRHLIFGMIECYPSEINSLRIVDGQTISDKNTRFFYIRQQLKIEDAIKIYTSAFDKAIPILWDKHENGKAKIINCGEMLDLLQWPRLGLVTEDNRAEYPFIGKQWSSARLHQLFPLKPWIELKKLLRYKKALNWLEDRLMFSLYDYDELIGSLQLVLPNPTYRKLDIHLLPNTSGTSEHVKFKFHLRENQTTDNLELCIAVKTIGLLCNHQSVNMQGKTSLLFPLHETRKKIAVKVKCKQRGIIDYLPFYSFVRQVCLNLTIATRQKEVTVSDTNEKYNTIEYGPIKEIKVGGAELTPELELEKKLLSARLNRQIKKMAAKFDQKIFYSNEEEAKNYLRELFQRAREEIIVIDPYASVITLFKYVYAYKTSNIKLKLITSARCLKQSTDLKSQDNGQSQKTISKGQELLEHINNLRESQLPINLEVSVMTGEPSVHDRFLIIDNEVWLSGNSLNDLGKRLSVLGKLHDPKQVLETLKTCLKTERTLTLEEWVKKTKK